MLRPSRNSVGHAESLSSGMHLQVLRIQGFYPARESPNDLETVAKVAGRIVPALQTTAPDGVPLVARVSWRYNQPCAGVTPIESDERPERLDCLPVSQVGRTGVCYAHSGC